MTRKTWLEVALNGGGGHAHQHLMPITADQLIAEGVACVEAGASIIHFHAYDPETEKQSDKADLYARVIEGIREKVDAIVYGTREVRFMSMVRFGFWMDLIGLVLLLLVGLVWLPWVLS